MTDHPFGIGRAPDAVAARRSRQALTAVSCFLPKKLAAQTRRISDLLRELGSIEYPQHPRTTMPPDEFAQAAVYSIIGKRAPHQFARAPDRRKLAASLLHFIGKKRTTIGDVVGLHAVAAPEVPAGLRRTNAFFDGWDPLSATYVAPPAHSLNAYLKDLVVFINEGAGYGRLWPLLTAVQVVLTHPFADGNGRLARSLFIALSARLNGYSIEIPQVVDRLWDNGCLLIHGLSGTVMAEADPGEFTHLMKVLFEHIGKGA